MVALSAMAARSQSLAEKSNSTEWMQRAAAARELSVVSIRPPKDDQALISLLAKEDAIVRAAFVEGTGASQKYGEEYAEYVGALTDTVMRIAENHPDYTDAWQALVNAPYDPESRFVTSLARHADKVATLLIAQASGADPSPGEEFQAHSIKVLGRISGFDRMQTNPKLTPGQTSAIDQIVRSSLKSQQQAVRIGAIKGLSAIGTSRDFAILERFSHDPELGRIATKALRDLRKRLEDVPQF